MIKQEKWDSEALLCCFPSEVDWGRGENRREQADFWKGFLKKNNEPPGKRINPSVVKKKDFLGFYECPFNCVIKNLNNNLKVTLNTETLAECFSFFPKGRRKARDSIA